MNECTSKKLTIDDLTTTREEKTFLEYLVREWKVLSQRTKLILFLYILIALCLSIFHLYTSYFGLLEAWAHRTTHMMLILLVVYFTPRKQQSNIEGNRFNYSLWKDLIPGIVAFAISIYIFMDYMEITIDRAGMPNMYDKTTCWLLVILILEGCRRRVGNAVAILGLISWSYVVWGHYIPGYFGHPRFSFGNITDFFFNNTTGILGIPTSVSALYIILFIILASFLYYANSGDFFLKLAYSLTGNWAGGPAKAAILASALFGSIHGSGPGNVMATGVFTIPLMKKLGYPAHFAGAVEAVASTGGILLPPIMGATAFLIAEFTGTPYIKVCLYAALPAICYYLVVFIQVHIEAVKQNLTTMDKKDLPKVTEVMKDGYLLLPIVVILVMLIIGYSVQRSASVAIGAIILLSFVRASTRMRPKDFLAALEMGASNAVMVAVTCLTASIIVGSVSMTGFGTKLANLIMYAAMGKVFLALFFTMIVSIVCGMGMPATPVYVILISTAAPALLKMGVPVIVSHMFIFYFGTMAALTPPVALSCYAAASVADADVNKLSFTAVKLALVGFLIPYIFVYNHGLLLMTGPSDALYAVLTALPGFIAMGIGVSGWFYGYLNILVRVLLVLGSLFFIWSGIITDIIGLCIIVPVLAYKYYNAKRSLLDRGHH